MLGACVIMMGIHGCGCDNECVNTPEEEVATEEASTDVGEEVVEAVGEVDGQDAVVETEETTKTEEGTSRTDEKKTEENTETEETEDDPVVEEEEEEETP
tara:strand:+ start:317 stop:616 length:300 start_codon:yes stop_codon:yes gene_type:complete